MQNGSSTPNISRVDAADRLIAAPPAVVFRAFAEPGALERWLPPRGMRGEMRVFDFRSGGSYRMRLTYDAPQPGQGKASDDADDVEVRLTRVEPERRVEQEVTFTSEDPAFAGTMRMTWSFDPEAGGTRVRIRAEDVPPGIRPEDHQAGFRSSLDNLARYVERRDQA